MEPRHLGVRAVVVKSFARIHETNLKKQGMLLTFVNKEDYEKVQETDTIDIVGLTSFAPQNLTIVLHHKDGSLQIVLSLAHSYNEQQIGWFKAGSVLNLPNKKSLIITAPIVI